MSAGADALLARARATYRQVVPSAAADEVAAGDAVLVDIRPDAQRATYGWLPSPLRPLVVDRNVLEWRFDPTGAWRLPEAGPDARVILLCQQGYQSSLAAANLVRMGVHRATDVLGGFEAWLAAGLPVERR